MERGKILSSSTSSAVLNTVMKYLPALQALKLQGLSRQCYSEKVALAQICVRLGHPMYFLDNRRGRIKLRSIVVPSLVVVKNRIVGDSKVLQLGIHWASCQVADRIYVTGGTNLANSAKCLLLKPCHSLSKSTFSCEEKKPMTYSRQEHSITAVKCQELVVCGGGPNHPTTSSIDATSKSAERYSIRHNKWELLPQLNVGRQRASSCSIGATVYVFCGMNSDQVLSSAERLDFAAAPILRGSQEWQLFNFPSIFPRCYPAVSVNGSEIVLMGGQLYIGATCGGKQPIRGFNDIIILSADLLSARESAARTAETVMADTESPFPSLFLSRNSAVVTGTRYVGRSSLREASYSTIITVDLATGGLTKVREFGKQRLCKVSVGQGTFENQIVYSSGTED